ncbi:MAG: methyltransferase domain-containing protein [Cellulosilyticum sp.]|nr:methyltransferase domain-containing protein [Cellulosilyticum sp.]
MLRETYEQIKDGVDVRKNLIELKKALKQDSNKMALSYYLAGEYDIFYKLLEHEDAKVRKNTALIMGELAVSEFLKPLFTAYQREDKLFVKADYLVAIRHLDYRNILEELKERLDFLVKETFEETSMKHINEERKILTNMILDIEGAKKHTFIGYNVLSDVILLTNRDHKEITLEQIKNGKAKTFNAGVVVCTRDLEEILGIRTYSEILFRLRDVLTVSCDPKQAAEKIWKGGLLDFLNMRHEEKAPYYFRLEVKSKMPLSEKSSFAKKLATALEEVSNRQVVNSTSNYEVELRLIENKDGDFNVLIKLYTIPDQRFSYRKHAVAASIQPVQAALIAELAKPYLKEGAQVLDPFCGVGTMLIERNKLVPATPMYGIDSFGEAIDKAIENSRRDHTIINFINRDFFDFKHQYLFDEIFTNMPTRGGRKTDAEMELLYSRFFKKALEILKDEAVMILYTRDRDLVLKGVTQSPLYHIEQNIAISKKEDAYLFIIKVGK